MQPGFVSVTVSTDGDITLPADVQAALGLKSGMRLAVSVRGNRLFLQPLNAPYFASLRGMLRNAEQMPFSAVREAKAEELALENAKLKRLPDTPR